MNFAPYLNKQFREKTLSRVLEKHDKNSDGIYSYEEISQLVKNAKSPLGNFVSIFVPTTKMTKEIFDALDNNKDRNITLEEFQNYLKQEFGLELESIKNKKVDEICNMINEITD